MSDLVEEIKAKLGIVEVVSQYVQLKKAGRNFKGLCPFHSEKSPSFVVSPEKQICHCFGCNKGGDIFSFIQEIEGVEFTEALNVLAERAGIKREQVSKFRKGGSVSKGVKEEFFKAHDLACEIFEKELFGSNDGKKVLDYLERRGLSEATIREFRLGFAPDRYDFLYPQLLKKGISRKILTQSGLVSSKKIDSDDVYDKYRGRLIFPINDYLGRICGFAGRALKKDQAPKYLNSPENLIYNKSKILYGMHKAKQQVKQKDQIVLVEGYFDMILPYQAGIKNVVATSGTALTPDHLKIVKRLTKNVVTCFDNDNAGFEATKRAYFLADAAKFSVKTVVALGEKDPADFVREHGDAFAGFVDGAKEFLEVYMQRLIDQFGTDGFDAKRRVIQELLPIFKALSPTARDYYVRALSRRLDVGEQSLHDEIVNFRANGPAPMPQAEEKAEIKRIKIDIDSVILGLLLEYPFLMEFVHEILDEEDFNGSLKSVYKDLTNQYNSPRYRDEGKFDEKALEEHESALRPARLYVLDKYGEFGESAIDLELRTLIKRFNEKRRADKLKEIENQIIEAENASDKSRLLELLSRQQKLISSKYGKKN